MVRRKEFGKKGGLGYFKALAVLAFACVIKNHLEH